MKKILDTLSDLPVNPLLDDIVCHAKTGGVTIVTAATASGKTLLVPTWLHLVMDRNITILEPRRFLAISAAETLASLSETSLGETISYAVSARGQHERVNRIRGFRGLMFTTYGYALAAKSLTSAQDIILDEAHEPGMDVSVCKALVKQRMLTPETRPGSVVIMSATLDAKAELEYWKDFNPKVFSIADEQRFSCTRRFEPATPVYKAALDLVDADRKGVLVFVSGMKEIEDVTKDLHTAISLRQDGEKVQIEIAGIHGNTDYSDRIAALAAPAEGYAKILVGTNVLETGMNIPWVDAGVSSGVHKENVVARESGAVALQEVPLSRANLDQQAGRTNRFRDSTFILCGRVGPNEMLSSPVSELKRLPLTQLFMHCVSCGVDPRDLDFLPAVDHSKLDDAKLVLQRFGFLDENDQLTPDGDFAQSTPVGLESSAFLRHAEKLGILPQALPLAAVYENGLILHDPRRPHGFNTDSDLIDGTIAFTSVYTLPDDLHYNERKEAIESMNVNRKKYIGALEILKSLEHALGIKADFSAYLRHTESDPEIMSKLRQCLLAGGINRLGFLDMSAYKRPVSMLNSGFLAYAKDIGSAVYGSFQPRLITTSLKEITPRGGMSRPFTVAWNITAYEADDIVAFHHVRPDVFTFELTIVGVVVYAFGRRGSLLYGFTDPDSIPGIRRSRHLYNDSETSISGSMGRSGAFDGESLGDILEKAIQARVSRLQDVVLESKKNLFKPGELGSTLGPVLEQRKAYLEEAVTTMDKIKEPPPEETRQKKEAPDSRETANPVQNNTPGRADLLKLAAHFNSGR